ncbi:MAG: leucine-rich repeat domain-containing protein [Bacteroidia bacterium]|nr:leucine-rich repeat domain-containing protein [Bacteroidia bacterium]MBP9180849.1 leucine-rich repeat domain-containing protein [Bacteroidia bacterium]MBP9724926.1 leucine-rich repeat domain-containing protein [Bacteroidia bacterium]
MNKQLFILCIILSLGVNYCFSQQYIPNHYSPDSVEEYSIIGEHLKAIPEELSKFTRLKKLDLRNNEIEEIPEFIFNMLTLEELSLSGNKIKVIPKNIAKLRNLKTLYLSDNKIDTLIIPQQHSLLNLHKLLLDNNNINSFEQLCNITNLDCLVLDKNNIQYIPNDISKLKHLTALNLSNNKIMNTEGLCQLTQLQYIFLENNPLTELPDCIGQLSSVKAISISDVSLPDSFFYLKNLSSLNIYNLKGELKIGAIDSLSSLYIDGADFRKMPNIIFELKNLTSLYLLNAKLVSVPKPLELLNKLWELDLSNNAITVIEADFRKLVRLNHLSISYNKITSLPVFSPNSQISVIGARNNDIRQLNRALFQIPTLKQVYLNNNKITKLPSRVCPRKRKYKMIVYLYDNPLPKIEKNKQPCKKVYFAN